MVGLRGVSLRDQRAGLREVSLCDHVVGLREFLLRSRGVYIGIFTPRHGVSQLKKVWKCFFTLLTKRHWQGGGGGGWQSKKGNTKQNVMKCNHEKRTPLAALLSTCQVADCLQGHPYPRGCCCNILKGLIAFVCVVLHVS